MNDLISPATWPAVSALLDEALSLPAEQRDTWLDGLQGEQATFKDTLRELLSRASGVETDDFLATLPRFTRVASAGPLTELATGDAIGPYRLLSELGTGGMGAVWLAERSDGTLKRKVALKLPRMVWARGLAERMARERDILASLEHPNIARLYDAGVDQHGRPYLALEYVEGQPIDGYAKERDLSVRQKLDLLLQVCGAVGFAHSRLVVHRDLKPSNILVTADGQVRLLDFGIAKLMEGDTTKETQLTQMAGRALTLDYASPEQIKGEPIGTASDVYSLGVVAYELLTGAKPYRLKRGSAAELEEAIVALDVPAASSTATAAVMRAALRGDLDAVLNKALKKDANSRYLAVDAMARDLRAHLEGAAVTARPDSLSYRLARLATRHRRNFSAAALASLAFGVGIGFGATTLVILLLSLGLGLALWLARRAQRERDLALNLSDRNEAATTFVNTLLTQASRSGEPLTADQLLERSERLLEEEFRDEPDSVATILSMMAMSAHTLGRVDRTIELLERSMTAVRGTADPALRHKIEIQYAVAIGQSGRVEDAVSKIEKVLARGGVRPEEAYEAHFYLSYLAYQRGSDPKVALHHAQEALRLHGRTRRPSKQIRASILAELADALFENGHVDEADRAYVDVMKLFVSLRKERSPAALVRRGNRAVMLEAVGDLPAAKVEFDIALGIALEDAPGEPPPHIMFIGRARAIQLMGRLDEAETDLQRGLDLANERGAMVPVQHTRCCLALLAVDRGDVTAARRGLQEYDEDRRVEIPPNSRTARLRQLAQGRLALLEQRGQHAVDAFSAAVGDGARSAMTAMGLLGRADALLDLGQHDAARADAQRALDMCMALQGSRHPSFRTGLALLSLARISGAHESSSDARALSIRALEQLELTVDPAHPARLAAAGWAKGVGS